MRTPALPCQRGGGPVSSLDISALYIIQFQLGHLGGVEPRIDSVSFF